MPSTVTGFLWTTCPPLGGVPALRVLLLCANYPEAPSDSLMSARPSVTILVCRCIKRRACQAGCVNVGDVCMASVCPKRIL
ncbi:hypothetical protein FKM82_028071 [Ascaphus truei]